MIHVFILILQETTDVPTTPTIPVDYSCLENRISTYSTNWDVTTKPAVRDMAEAGFYYTGISDIVRCFTFYYTGISDIVRCFTCGLQLEKWFQSDIPLKEHQAHREECEFLF